MCSLQSINMPKSFSLLSSLHHHPNLLSISSISCRDNTFRYRSLSNTKPFPCLAVSRSSDLEPDSETGSKHKDKPKTRTRRKKASDAPKKDEESGTIFPTTIPRKPRRGRRSEAVAVEDFVRGSLERTFASIRQQNPELLENEEHIVKDKVEDNTDSETSDEDDSDMDDDDELEDASDFGSRKGKKKKMVVEEENPNWPLDADVGWGIRASEYFEKHSIKNVVAEDGFEIDWEGEIDDNWVKEINCLEWESFAFHPSPLIVLVFERYNRASENWKTLKELEKAVKVYWSAKDRLPPRSSELQKSWCR